MRVFMLHVGDPLEDESQVAEQAILWMNCFNDGQKKRYLKKDIINATNQMISLEKSGVDIHYGFLTHRRSPLELYKVGIRLKRIVETRKIDLVHVLWGMTTAFIGVIFSPVPVIVSFCGSDLFRFKGNRRGSLLSMSGTNLLSQVSALRATRIIVKSKALLDVLWVPSKEKATVIPNGVDMGLFVPIDQDEAKQRLQWSPHRKNVLFFPGGGSPVKDPQLALAAFSYVKKEVPECELVFLDDVPHEELKWYYSAADAMLITSVHEGSNNSIKEAMSCNLPIVSTLCGDASERLASVEQSGTVESRSPEDIGEFLVQVLRQGGRSTGREHISELSVENVAKKIIRVYEDTLAST